MIALLILRMKNTQFRCITKQKPLIHLEMVILMNFNGIIPSQIPRLVDLHVFILKKRVPVTFCSYIFNTKDDIKKWTQESPL